MPFLGRQKHKRTFKVFLLYFLEVSSVAIRFHDVYHFLMCHVLVSVIVSTMHEFVGEGVGKNVKN
jgi:hypothetical protein